MAKMTRRHHKGGSLVALRDNVGALLTATGTNPVHSTSTTTLSVESMGSPSFADDIDAIAVALKPDFETALGDLSHAAGLNNNSHVLSTEGIAGAAIMARALRDVASARQYHAAAMDCSVRMEEGVTVIPASNNPAFGYSLSPTENQSFEAFDARNLEQLRATQVMFSCTAAIQDEFAEAFFDTVTLAPDGTGLEMSIRRAVVMQEQRHPQNGNVINFEPRNLLDAYTEPKILINQSTRIYPRVIVGDAESEKHFVDKAIFAPYKTTGANGAVIDTAPIRVGERINLIGAGANERTPGTMDQTDAIDSALNVIGTYWKVTAGGKTSIVKFNTSTHAGNAFQKSFENHSRRVSLDFSSNAMYVNAETVDVLTGQPAEVFAFLNAAPYTNVTLQLEAHITGEANLQYGWCSVNHAKAHIAHARTVYGPNDLEVIRDQATLKDLEEALGSFELIGYDIKAYYPNTNKRFLGLLIDTVEERVRYVVPLLPPISVQTPITATATQTELSGPINAQRITNSINAVTKIIETRDTLREVMKMVDYSDNSIEIGRIEGFARTMVMPYLFDDVINLADVVQSLSSANRTTDVQAALVNRLRYAVATAYTESRYQPALDAHTGTSGARPTVVIGTDPRIASYLMVNGDPRLLGLGMESKIVVSYDYRMRNNIVASFVRPNVSEVDIMSFGTFAYIPELMTTANLPYNGSNTTVTQVQNRNLHVVTLPIMIWMEVQGLEQSTSKSLPYQTTIN